ncbi:MAG: hypothetical protein OEY52_07300 [Gammaproteobacteria bacterium]|nr:hypothetical protein [Gammaproteobacteria bacterium]
MPGNEQYRKKSIRVVCFGLGLLSMFLIPAYAWSDSLAPPEDPRQSITYWRQHTLSAEEDSLTAMAQGVFQVLLRAWDNTRLEPGLHVVKSSSGPWAASLADGNILLSRAAIETCLKYGKHRAEHLLAFVLAHELAHQRSDDLWHQRFFRLIGEQGQEVKSFMLGNIKNDNKLWQDISQKENQADHDGLILMASVGYDPYQVLDKKDFFTAWVENIWQTSCSKSKSKKEKNNACQQARHRALRAHVQLKGVATQSTLYQMGLQAFIAGRYELARRYFTVYGRDFTNRAVLTAIGQTYFTQALNNYRQLVEEFGWAKPVYYYPILIDASASMSGNDSTHAVSSKRTDLSSAARKIKKKMQQNIQQSIEYFEKAIKLEPNNPKTYLLLAFSYLLDQNSYMVRGIIQGKYLSLFGRDAASDMILAMTSGLEGNIDATEKAFEALLVRTSTLHEVKSIPDDILLYSVYHNSAAYARYLGKSEKAKELWQKLAMYARDNGKPVLFQLAVSHINKQTLSKKLAGQAPTIHGVRLGDKGLRSLNRKTEQNDNLWIEGDKYQIYRTANGGHFILDMNNRVINAWQYAGIAKMNQGIVIGDKSERAIKTLGTPNRQIHLMSGEYLAYDTYGIAIHILQDRISGWFLYQPE